MSSFKMADEIQDGRQFVRDFLVILDLGVQKRVKYSFLTNASFITFNQYKNTFRLSYCTSLYDKIDIFTMRAHDNGW